MFVLKRTLLQNSFSEAVKINFFEAGKPVRLGHKVTVNQRFTKADQMPASVKKIKKIQQARQWAR